jgi:hypothetical protein
MRRLSAHGNQHHATVFPDSLPLPAQASAPHPILGSDVKVDGIAYMVYMKQVRPPWLLCTIHSSRISAFSPDMLDGRKYRSILPQQKIHLRILSFYQRVLGRIPVLSSFRLLFYIQCTYHSSRLPTKIRHGYLNIWGIEYDDSTSSL